MCCKRRGSEEIVDGITSHPAQSLRWDGRTRITTQKGISNLLNRAEDIYRHENYNCICVEMTKVNTQHRIVELLL